MTRSQASGRSPRRKAVWLAAALALTSTGVALSWALADDPAPPEGNRLVWTPADSEAHDARAAEPATPARRSQAVFTTLGIKSEALPGARLPEIEVASHGEPVLSPPVPAPQPKYVGRVAPVEIVGNPPRRALPIAAPQPYDAAYAQAEIAPPGAPAPVPDPEPPTQLDRNRGEVTGDFDIIPQTGVLEVNVGRSLLLRTRADIYRTAVVDPRTCEVIQFTPREISLIGKGTGATHVTFWFKEGDGLPVTYLVKVAPDPVARQRLEQEYFLLENLVAKLFPDSKVYLLQVADKLIVRGQAKDAEEAASIMAVIRGQAGGRGGRSGAGNGNRSILEGSAAQVLTSEETGRQNRPRVQVLNMLRVPGVQQVALRVKIAELNRSAARGIGVDVNARINFSDNQEGSALFLSSLLNAGSGGAPALLAQFDGDDIQIGVNYLQQRGVVRLLSEPTVVTMSGQAATFVAGGEFAVPTVVGTAGLNAVTTDFRSFGAIISVMPTVVDKDRIRLSVSPEFSQINQSLSVGGTPGLNVRAVTTTVEMREGQTLAIAGLLEDTMTGNAQGNLPGLSWLFGNRSMSRNETELIILVTPELVHPMEADEVPPLPGFDVTEPTNGQFFIKSRIEGDPTMEYRSTVWPHLRHRYKAGGSAMISGPFGHGK
jgi:pilus assembly protein CpaC